MLYSWPILSLFVAAKAALLPPMNVRAVSPECNEAYRDILMVEFNDGPTTSLEAGIGAEFESVGIQFTDEHCSLEDTFAAKRKTVQGHSGRDFVLSVDTSAEQGAGRLSAEYVLDGRNIKVNESAAVVGRAVYHDLASWTPWNEDPPDRVIIEQYQECPDPWEVRNLNKNTNKDLIIWLPQITTSMPLEALYSLMIENVQKGTNEDGRNILNGIANLGNGQDIQLVTKEYFYGLWHKIHLEEVNDAVLGFCTLVLSYAKAADKAQKETDRNSREKSPKSWTPFMPRTEFVTIYGTVKSFFSVHNQLFDIFNTLACYKTVVDKKKKNKLTVEIDTDWCTGTVESPKPGTKFGNLQYRYVGEFGRPNIPTTLSIRQWIHNIGEGTPGPDLLTVFDQHYDGSIGGLGTQVEKMFNLRRNAPLFEFRSLKPLKAPEFENFLGDVDSAIQELHKKFATPPMRNMKRDSSACPPFSNITSPATTPPTSSDTKSSTSPATTPPPRPSCVVQDEDPGLGITSQGCICEGSSTWQALSTPSNATYGAQCAYTAPPSSSAQATITQAPMKPQTNTPACMVCTPQYNFEDDCTSMPSCTPQSAYATATVNSSPVHYGTLSRDALFTGISTALKSACSSITTGTATVSGTPTPTVACDKEKDYTVGKGIPYIISDSLQTDGTLSINIGSYAATAGQLNALIAVAASMVTRSANASERSCHEGGYMTLERRGILGDWLPVGISALFARDRAHPEHRNQRLCNGPAVVVASYWAPGYRDRIGSGNRTPDPDAQLTATLKFTQGPSGKFFCEFMTGMAEIIMLEVAPELSELDIFGSEQLLAACEEATE